MSNDPKHEADSSSRDAADPDDRRVPIEVAIAEEAPDSEGREFISELVDVREELFDLIADD